jgi:hypothetical protein
MKFDDCHFHTWELIVIGGLYGIPWSGRRLMTPEGIYRGIGMYGERALIDLTYHSMICP